MKVTEKVRRIVSVAVVTLALFGLFASRAGAQSELRGDRMPYDAFDKLAKTDLDVPGGVVHVAFAPGDFALPKDRILDFVRTSARAVSTYYGRFPVSAVKLLIVPVEGPRVRGGTTWGYRAAAIRLMLGRDASEDDLRRDWVLVHEMTHLALPEMAQRYGWLSEGLAVYIEPVAWVQAGDLTAKEIWQAMMRDMPKGLPQPVTKASTIPIPGAASIGAARCSACSPISKFAKRLPTVSACRMRCAASSRPAAMSRPIGRSGAFLERPTRRWDWMC